MYLPNILHIQAISPLAMHLQSSHFVQDWMCTNCPGYLVRPACSNVDALAALDYLAARSIYLDAVGQPNSQLSQHALDVSLPLTFHTSKVLSSLMPLLYDLDYSSLLASCPSQADAARIRSCAGQGNGEIYRTIPVESDLRLSDLEFAHNLGWRSGMRLLRVPGLSCMHTYPRADFCASPLDDFGNHSSTCGIG